MLKTWFGLYLEGILHLEVRGFAAESAAFEEMLVPGEVTSLQIQPACFQESKYKDHWNENRVTMFIIRMPLYTIFSRKPLFKDRTGQTHVNSMEA